MFNSFSNTALRVLKRKKSFSALHIVGLAIGIATSLLIFLIIRNELSYDRYHKNADRIYRVMGTRALRSNGEIAAYESSVPNPFADVLPLDMPELEAIGTISNPGEGQIYVPQKDGSEEKRFKENDGLAFVNADMFQIFDFSWLAGNATALTEPNTAVLSETTANKYFGSYEKAMGSIVQLWSFRKTFRVVGIYKDLPGNTDVKFRIGFSDPTLNSILGINDQKTWNRNNGTLQCFVLAPTNKSIQNLEAQLPAFVKKYYPEDRESTLSLPTLHFQPLKEMHLNKQYDNYSNDGLSVKDLWALGLIGSFLLLVACINFINLATAQAATRAKEIGVRKVLGSDRSQIKKQFFYETGFITLFAVVLGCILTWIALPWLDQLMQKHIVVPIASLLLFLGILFVVVTVLAGFYPAVVLSGFSPISIFRNKMSAQVGGISLRKALVIFQFVIAQLLIIGTVVVVTQMQYFRTRSLGFDKDGIALINLPSDSTLRLKRALLKTSLEQVPGVVSTSLCMGGPSNFWEWNTPIMFDNKTNPEEFRMAMQVADTGYYKTFNIQLVAGRLPFYSDTLHEVVVNETMVKKLGLKSADEVLGKTVRIWDGQSSRLPVVGVVRDYNNRSLAQPISAMAIGSHKSAYEYVAVRVNKQRMSQTLDQLQKVFTQIYPTYLYDRTFLDDRLAQYYQSEAITAQLFKVFAFLAIFISCLGLYGLVSFMAIQKTKEVGIRKVLGASVQSIVYLFSKEFTVLIGIAFLIAAPVGYYFMHEWLSRFHYRIDLGWGIFALAMVSSVVLAWITVGYKAFKAALVNPVTSLKTE